MRSCRSKDRALTHSSPRRREGFTAGVRPAKFPLAVWRRETMIAKVVDFT